MSLVKEKLERLLLPLAGVSCSFHFSKSAKEVFLQFCEAFGLNHKVPDYLAREPELYETGEGKWKGLQISVFGPHSPNPNYILVERSSREKELDGLRLQVNLSQYMVRAVQMLATKDIVTIDFDRARAFFKAVGLDFDLWFGSLIDLRAKTQELYKAEESAVGTP